MRETDWFPAEQHEPFRQCWERGDSVAAIRERFGLSEAQVLHRRKSLKLAPRRPHDGASQTWTDERVETLKTLWAAGFSASQIVFRIGGVTRNAVIGKVHRLGLSGRGTSVRRSSAPRTRRNKAGREKAGTGRSFSDGAVEPPEPPPPPAPDSAHIPFTDAKPGQCLWIVNDPKAETAMCCGAPTERRRPGDPETYCPHHKHLTINHAATARSKRKNGGVPGAARQAGRPGTLSLSDINDIFKGHAHG